MLGYLWGPVGTPGEQMVVGGLRPPDGAVQCAVLALRRGRDPRIPDSWRIVWWRDVLSVLCAWARWCALQLAHLWACPTTVHDWLATGAPVGGNDAYDLAIEYSENARGEEIPAAMAAVWAATGDVWASIRSAEAAGLPAICLSTHLRRLLLEAALPHHLHPMIDLDEEVLSDMLLRRVLAC